MIADCGQRLTVEFTTERCENCSCAKSLASSSPVVTFERAQLASAQDPDVGIDRFQATGSSTFSSRLEAGQSVELRLPGRALLICAGVLFGVPLLLAVVAGLVGDWANFSGATQAVLILGGFVLGGLASYRLRSLLRSSIYSGLSITTLDC